MKHRGPDDAGIRVWNADGQFCSADDEKGCVGLAHRRLSIIDLSLAGRQPMSNEAGDLWIAYNGEFYNFLRLRDELESCGKAPAWRLATGYRSS